jgi:hypothetical protein
VADARAAPHPGGKVPITEVGCQRGPKISPTSFRRTHSTLLLGALGLAALLVGLWFVLRPTSLAPRSDAVAAEPARPEPAPELTDAGKTDLEATAARAAAPRAEEPAPKPIAAAAVAEKPDPDAREWIVFRVKDEHGTPVAGAEVRLSGLRRKSERGSVYAWRGEPDSGTTARDGTLRLPYPVWVTLDDETASLVVFVHHPDFTTYEDQDCTIRETVDITMRRGSSLVIAGWFGSRETIVTDVRPHFSWDVDLRPEDWLPRRDGRLTTTRMKPGHHVVFLEWRSPEHGTCFSDLTPFETVAGEDQELLLELRPGKTLKGRLGPEVPRPVVDGEVSVGIGLGPQGENGRSLLHRRGAPVQPDGTFEVAGLPRAEAQIVGVCRGFAAVCAVESNEHFERRIAPVIDLRTLEDEYELEMEPTAVLEIELRGPDGKPARGVHVAAWPNVCWRVQVCSNYAEQHGYYADSDAEGRVRIEDVPAGEHYLGVEDETLDLPREGTANGPRDRIRRVKFPSGQTVRLAFDLERKTGG